MFGSLSLSIYLFARKGVAVLASVVSGGLSEPKVTFILFSYLVGRETRLPPPTRSDQSTPRALYAPFFTQEILTVGFLFH